MGRDVNHIHGLLSNGLGLLVIMWKNKNGVPSRILDYIRIRGCLSIGWVLDLSLRLYLTEYLALTWQNTQLQRWSTSWKVHHIYKLSAIVAWLHGPSCSFIVALQLRSKYMSSKAQPCTHIHPSSRCHVWLYSVEGLWLCSPRSNLLGINHMVIGYGLFHRVCSPPIGCASGMHLQSTRKCK